MKLYEFLLNNAPYHTGIYATTSTIVEEDPYYLLNGKYAWLNEGKWIARHHNIDDLRNELEDKNVEDFVINDWLNREIVEFDSFFNYLDAAKFFIEKMDYPSVPKDVSTISVALTGIEDMVMIMVNMILISFLQKLFIEKFLPLNLLCVLLLIGLLKLIVC